MKLLFAVSQEFYVHVIEFDDSCYQYLKFFRGCAVR